jgi:hypothetical protein
MLREKRFVLPDPARDGNPNLRQDWFSKGGLNRAFLVKNYFLDPVGGITGQIKVDIAGTYVAKPVKWWDGAAWVTKPLKRFNGTLWVPTNY